MTPVRLIMFGLIIALILTPLLGFAAGDVALQTWNKHPHQATGQHHAASRLSCKSTPGVTAVPPPTLVLAPAGWLPASVPGVARLGVSRPPFVPPRS